MCVLGWTELSLGSGDTEGDSYTLSSLPSCPPGVKVSEWNGLVQRVLLGGADLEGVMIAAALPVAHWTAGK